MVKSVTVELDVELLEALQKKAASTSCSLSQLVNMAVREFIVDDEELAAVGEGQPEPVISYSEALQELSSPTN
ncbi:MAG: CopG family transcriptional regulator [Dehalococcoidia bacterium]|jgi:predicted transcriptional regulator